MCVREGEREGERERERVMRERVMREIAMRERVTREREEGSLLFVCVPPTGLLRPGSRLFNVCERGRERGREGERESEKRESNERDSNEREGNGRERGRKHALGTVFYGNLRRQRRGTV